MALFSTIRIAIFSFAIVGSLIELGINAYFLSLTAPNFYYIFSALGTATSLLTLLTVPVMLMVDFMRRGAFPSMIVVELVWLFILWVLWVATAGEAANIFNVFCIYDPAANPYCMEVQAVQAFAFLNFIMFLGYTGVLLVFSIIASSNGKNVWTSSVKESTFFTPSGPSQPQIPLAQYSGGPAKGYDVAQPGPQQLGGYNYNGMPAQSPHIPQQMSHPSYGGAPQQTV